MPIKCSIPSPILRVFVYINIHTLELMKNENKRRQFERNKGL
jgi:hypothetical protein